MHRLRLPEPLIDQDLVRRCRAARGLLPHDSAFSHVTAARLLGLPVPYVVEADERLHVIRPGVHAQTRIAGVVGHRYYHPRAIMEVHGVPVTDLADTWADLGEFVGRGKPLGLDDLIIVGDACATRLETVSPLHTVLAKRVRPRGKRTLVEALTLIRVGSASPMETVARIMFVRAGLPEPLPNEPVYAADGSGRLLGFGDFVWRIERRGAPPIKVVGEYQGEEFHCSDEQREHDDVRRQGFEDEGWTVHEIWRADVTGDGARRELVERLAWSLQVSAQGLRLADVGSRFFSQYAMDRAMQRAMSR